MSCMFYKDTDFLLSWYEKFYENQNQIIKIGMFQTYFSRTKLNIKDKNIHFELDEANKYYF